jgi:hypothetical protein
LTGLEKSTIYPTKDLVEESTSIVQRALKTLWNHLLEEYQNFEEAGGSGSRVPSRVEQGLGEWVGQYPRP